MNVRSRARGFKDPNEFGELELEKKKLVFYPCRRPSGIKGKFKQKGENENRQKKLHLKAAQTSGAWPRHIVRFQSVHHS